MRLSVVAIGRLKDGPERELVARYSERARAAAPALGLSGPDILEISESRARRDLDRKREEAAAIRDRLAGAVAIAFDENGRSPTSEAFAADIARRRDAGERHLAFVIGGADGLDADLLATAAARISIGGMTMPHQLVRVLALEQIYRAMTILGRHPYHRT
jgi:23S rRNA (pseudouridine1915-N3)-methyltransferase